MQNRGLPTVLYCPRVVSDIFSPGWGSGGSVPALGGAMRMTGQDRPHSVTCLGRPRRREATGSGEGGGRMLAYFRSDAMSTEDDGDV